MTHDHSIPLQQPGAGRRTIIGLTAFAIFMAVVDVALLHGAGWGVIFWGRDRPRLLTIVFTLLMLVAFAMLQRGILLRRSDQAATRWLAGGAALFVLTSLVTAFGILQTFANSGDEYAYWFGAETYLNGHLWNASPPLGQAMASNYTWVAGAKWAGQYPPGWPGLMAAFGAVGLSPWIVGTLLAAGTMFGLHALIRREAGVHAATLGALAFAAAPFTVFTAASLHSHTMAAVLTVAALLAFARSSDSRSAGCTLLTGALIGLLGITRSVTAVAVLIPMLVALAARRDFRTTVLIGIGGIPFAALLLWYQGSITGDPLKPVYWLAGRNVDHLYFDLPSIKLGLIQTVNRSAGLFLWASPVLPLLWVVAIVRKVRMRTLGAADFVFPIGVLIFAFYPLHAGNSYGPRYYFDFWPLLVFTVASALKDLDPVKRRLGEALLALSILYGIMVWPLIAYDFHRITFERRDLYLQVEKAGLSNAAVCIRSGAGPTLEIIVSDLARNGVHANGEVLYVRCDMVTLPELTAAFPGRTIWYYDRTPTAAQGQLTRIR